MSYIGNSPENVLRNRRAIYEFVATAGQTAFSGVDSNGATLDLLQDNEQSVFLNGVRLIATDDYTVSGDILTLVQAASVGDILIVETQGEVANATTYTRSEADARYVNYNGDVISGNIQIAGDLTANSLAIDTDVLYVDATNNRVGINLPGLNPQEALHVAGNIRVNNNQEFRTIDTGGSTRTIMRVNNSDELEYGWSGGGAVKFMGGGSYTERMRIHTNSNIGINDIAPHGTLTVTGPRVLVQRSGDDSSIAFSDNATGAPTSHTWAAGLNYSNDQAFTIAYNASQVPSLEEHRMVIETGGKVAFGSDDPWAKMHLQINDSGGPGSGSSAGMWLRNSSGSAGQAFNMFWGNTESSAAGSIALVVDDNTNNYGSIQFQTRSSGGYSTKMEIDGTGNVLVGTTDTTPYNNSAQSSADNGIALGSTGIISAAKFNDSVLLLNRTGTNDGSIIDLKKNGGTIGSIGTVDSDLNIYPAAAGHKGLRFGNGYLAPTSNSTTVENGTTDLGLTSYRFKDLYMTGTVNANDVLLDAVEKTLTDTIVDAFIYDTRKDSDGGAWRKRIQHTSWYNEALGTSTRGSRKEFPAVAVIVATSNYKVIIYDGDDPTLPMWMEFELANYNVASNWATSKFGLGSANFQAGDPTTVRMINGQLVIGMELGSSHGGYMVNFISELMIDMVSYGSASNQFYHYLGNISQRNSNAVYSVPQKYSYGEVDPRIKGRIIHGQVLDIAMTVLPNAPIDPDTGLPNPTIAIGTGGGISIIKDNLKVTNIMTTTIQHETPMDLKFIGNRLVWVAQNNYDNGWSSVYSAFLPSEDITINYNNADYSFSKYSSVEWSTHATNGSSLTIPISMNSPRTSVMIETDNEGNIIIGGKHSDDHGGIIRLRENLTNLDQGMIAHIASDYTTGYQVGDIKIATLCSTDTTDITSSNQAGNGNFANTTVWFTQNGATLTVSGNEGTITADGSTTQAYIGQTISGLTVGKTYVIRAEAKRGTTTAQAAITVNGILTDATTSTNFTPLHVKFVAISTSQLVLCFLNGSGSQSGTAVFKNFSFRLAEEDRSKNRQDLSTGPHGGNAIDVYGTVTKLPVATGAALQSYGNFSSSDYLERPCLTDFEFGTGDWSVTGWVSQHADDASTQHVVQIGASNGASSEISIMRQTSSSPMNLGFFVRGDSGSINMYPAGGLVDTLTFRHFVMTKRGDWLYWFVDGKVLATIATSNFGNIGFAPTDPFRIGNGDRIVTADRMKISLLRISADPLSDEQIKYMYEEEKHLFQENADASLIGTSNAITALAHDKETDLLHVGTSWGRSVFQGLRLVDSDLGHVPQVVIRASNGMIVEE